MKRLAWIIILSVALLNAQSFKGSVSTGFYMGMPYWNADNTDAGKVIDANDAFLRSVNQLRLSGTVGGVKLMFSAIRSDGFQSENRLSETKIFSLYGQYDFSRGKVQVGRIVPFMRWVRGSIDGAVLDFAINKRIGIKILGGLQAPFGSIFNPDTTQQRIYIHVQYAASGLRMKLKMYKDEAKTKVGADVFGRLGKLRYSANYGYDVTDSQLSDGGLSLYYPFNNRFTAQASYRLFRTLPWNLGHIQFQSYMIDRIYLGLRYRVWNNMALNLNQMVTLTSERTDYLTMLVLSGRFFQVGVNYLSGQENLQRLGIMLGGHYRVMRNLTVSGGVAPVDYLHPEEDEHVQSIAFYLRAQYRFLQRFAADVNLNYYQKNDVLNSPVRGGVRLMYYFGS